MNKTRLFQLGEICYFKATKVKVTILDCHFTHETGWNYYLKGWGKPVTEDQLEKITSTGK